MKTRGFEILPEFADTISSLEKALGLEFIPQRGTSK